MYGVDGTSIRKKARDLDVGPIQRIQLSRCCAPRPPDK